MPRSRHSFRLLRYALLIAIAVVILLPYVWMLSGSLVTDRDLCQPVSAHDLDVHPAAVDARWLSGTAGLKPLPFTNFVFNSLFVAITVTALSVVVNLSPRTSSARVPFGAEISCSSSSFTMIIPFEVLAILCIWR